MTPRPYVSYLFVRRKDVSSDVYLVARFSGVKAGHMLGVIFLFYAGPAPQTGLLKPSKGYIVYRFASYLQKFYQDSDVHSVFLLVLGMLC